MRRLSLFLIVLTVSCLSAFAQMFEPVKWKFSTKAIDQSTVELVFSATIADLYLPNSCSRASEVLPSKVRW